MSNPENEQRKPRMNNWVWLLLTIITCFIVGIIVYNNNDTIARWANQTRLEKAQKWAEEHKTDSTALEIQSELIEEAENPTIVEYLQFREDMIEQQRKEEVFKTMPTVVLIDILSQHGTALNVYDIVDIYENYPDTYNIIQSGARAQQFLDSLRQEEKKNITPDSIPKKAPIDSVLSIW